MSLQFVVEGLDDLIQALRTLPENLANEAAGIIEHSTQSAAARIREGYPARAEKLRRGVKTKITRSGVTVVGRVSSTAKTSEGISLALLFEIGTQARHNALGANRGSMPAGHVAVPIIQREQRAMYDQLRQLLSDHGLEVTG